MSFTKKTSRIILLSVLLILVMSCVAFSADKLVIKADDIVYDGSGEVSVDITAVSNPGYAAGLAQVSWNTDALELVRVEYNSSVAPDNGSKPVENISPYSIVFGDYLATSDFKKTGTMFTLVFKVGEDVGQGKYSVNVSGNPRNFLNYEMSVVPVSFVNGSVTIGSAGTLTESGSFPFKDIAEDNPNREAIAKVHELGIIAGTTADTFSPDMTLSRAMIVAMLWRLEGRPEVAASSFSDVPSGKYYTTAVAWAVSNKIASGYNDGKFRPEQDVTRQELAAFLYRYAKLKDKGFKGAWMFPLSYPDVDDISSYAYEPLCWMVMNGIMKEQPSGKIAPKVRATREETAVAFAGLVEALK